MWEGFIGVAVGGLIGILGSLANTRFAARHEWTDRKRWRFLEVLVDWAGSVEHLLSHHPNYYGLASLLANTPAADSVRRRNAEAELERVSQNCGEAGRRLDALRYSVLILGRDQWMRDEVGRITERTFLREANQILQGQRAGRVRDLADEIRKELAMFLSRVSEAKCLT